MSKCDFVFRYGGPRCPYPCSREAEFEAYEVKVPLPVRRCCSDHLVLTLYDFVGACVVTPIPGGAR